MTAPVDLRLHDATLPDRVATLLAAPAELLLPERLLIYALVRGLAPRRCLEIGTHFGGSTTILVGALDDLGGDRKLVCVDPNPLVPTDVWATIAHRTTLLRGSSPLALDQALAEAGEPFDFVFIDGDHTREGARRDIDGVLDVAAPGAHLLLHDAHYHGVADAIADALDAHAGLLIDAGLVSSHGTPPRTRPNGVVERWGGLRLLRTAPAGPAGRS